MALPGLGYSKRALLVFGAGLVLGLAVVSAELRGLARLASLAMALGIAALPFALFADWRRAVAGRVASKRRKPRSRRQSVPAPRRRARRKR